MTIFPGKEVQHDKQVINEDLEHPFTVVNAKRLQYYLERTKYDAEKTKFLVDGFVNGFSIGYEGPTDRKSTSRNIPFTPGVGDEREMWSKIMSEVSENRVAGPFEIVPFDYFIQSPIGLVPKHGNKTRLIFHLSYNFPDGSEGGGSLNHHTPRELCTVHYKDLDYAVRCCLRVKNSISSVCDSAIAYMSKTDIRSAFRTSGSSF